jgi:hypothetical protein
MLCTKIVYITRVSVRHGVRSYSLISFGKSPAARNVRAMSPAYITRAWVDVSRLGAIILRLELLFSVSRRANRFPHTFPLTTLEEFGVGYYLSYSATANAGRKQRREELQNVSRMCPECVHLKNRVGTCQRDLVEMRAPKLL